MRDLISRQAAIDAIEHRLAEPAYQHTGEDWYVGMNCAESELYDLPSVEPEQRIGKWISKMVARDGEYAGWICSNCGYFAANSKAFLYNYCPNYGVYMRGRHDGDK